MSTAITRIALAGLLSAALGFSGCSNTENIDGDGDTLTVYVLQGYDFMEVGTSSTEYLVRQAGSLFENDYPDATVEVRVGIPTNAAISADDAIRALNASLVSGDGPDVIILDGLPIERLTSQGMLHDLSTVLNQMDPDSLFQNARNSSDAIDYFAVPAAFAIPLVAGNSDLLNQFNTASELADLVRDDPQAASALASGTGIHELLAAFYPSFFKNGQLDRKTVATFLESARTILLASAERWAGLNPESEFDAMEFALGSFGRPAGTNFSDCALFAESGTAIALDSLSSATGYGYLLLSEEHATYPCAHKALTQDTDPVAVPTTLMGISASSPRIDLAESFLKHMLSKEVQEDLIGSGMGVGIPASKAAFESINKDAGAYSVGFMGNETEPGQAPMLNYERGPLTETEMRECCDLIESATTTVVFDQVVLDALADNLRYYCNGKCSLDEAVEDCARTIERHQEA